MGVIPLKKNSDLRGVVTFINNYFMLYYLGVRYSSRLDLDDTTAFQEWEEKHHSLDYNMFNIDGFAFAMRFPKGIITEHLVNDQGNAFTKEYPREILQEEIEEKAKISNIDIENMGIDVDVVLLYTQTAFLKRASLAESPFWDSSFITYVDGDTKEHAYDTPIVAKYYPKNDENAQEMYDLGFYTVDVYVYENTDVVNVLTEAFAEAFSNKLYEMLMRSK